MNYLDEGYEPIGAIKVNDDIKVQWAKSDSDTLNILTERYTISHEDYAWAISYFEAQQ